jgi:hypothetical protein
VLLIETNPHTATPRSKRRAGSSMLSQSNLARPTDLQPYLTNAIALTPCCDLSVPALALLRGGTVHNVFPLPDHGRCCRNSACAHRKDADENVLGARSPRERCLHVSNPRFRWCLNVCIKCGMARRDCRTVQIWMLSSWGNTSPP